MKPAKKRRPSAHPGKDAGTYLALGAAALGLMGFVWVAQGNRSGSWPVQAWVLFWGLIALGLIFVGAGILASGITLAERLRAWPDTGVKMLVGLGALAALFGWTSVMHYLFPSLDARGLRWVVSLSLALVPLGVVFAAMLRSSEQSRRFKKKIDQAKRNVGDEA